METSGAAEVKLQRLCVWTLLLVAMLEAAAKQTRVSDEAQVSVIRAASMEPRTQPSSGHQTRHSTPEVKQRTFLEKITRPPPSSILQPIRIKTWRARESCKLSEPESERLEEALEEAVRVVSSLLSVNRTVGTLLLSRDINKYCKFVWRNSSLLNYNRCGRANKNYRTETCLDVTIPEEHLSGCYVYPEADSPRRTVVRPEGAGLPDTDFLLYIHVQATDKCRAEPGVLAYAVHCQTDAGGRPVAGVMVLCRDRLSGASCSHQATVQTLIHEMFHTLGFSKDLFSSWQDCSSDQGASCSPRNKVIHSDGSGQPRIYTPAIVSALQRHLMSSDPELGGPLENLDESAGKVSSHWESRVLQGSIMAAALGDPTTVRIDPVTLAALQDTGWYSVNLSRAQSLVWGDVELDATSFTSTKGNVRPIRTWKVVGSISRWRMEVNAGRKKTQDGLQKTGAERCSALTAAASSPASPDREATFGPAALLRVAATDTDVLDPTGTRSRCLALNGWTAQQGAPLRLKDTEAKCFVLTDGCVSTLMFLLL